MEDKEARSRVGHRIRAIRGSMPAWSHVAIAAVLILGVAVLDVTKPFDRPLSMFYLLPVLYIAWTQRGRAEIALYVLLGATVYLAPALAAPARIMGRDSLFNRSQGIALGLGIVWLTWDRRRFAALLERTNQELEERVATRTGELSEANRLLQREVAERRRAEDDLRRASAFRDAVIHTAAEGICVCHPGGPAPFVRFSVWNGRMTEITGYTMAEMNELGTQILWPEPGEHARVMAALARAAEGESLDAAESRIVNRDGARRVVEISTSVVASEAQERAVVFLVHDVSHRKQAEAERQRLEERLRRGERMEAVGQLAGGVAHDFNNLLMVIQGRAAWLEECLPPSAPEREDVTEIARASERASSLIRQLVAFSRQQRLQPRTLDLNDLIGSTETLIRRLLTEKIRLVTSLSPALEPIRADPCQLEQVLLNLAANARDAMREGGEFRLTTSQVFLSVSEAGAAPDAGGGPYARLTATDTGCGMDAPTRERVFDPFFTTKEIGKGTGLGLASVYGTIRQSGGQIEVSSEPGRGTTFTIYLPSTRELPAVRGPVRVLAERAPSGRETVLLVEDEDSVRKLLAEVLRNAGYTVLEAPDGRQALTLASHRTARIDVLVTDVVMPEMSGKELAARLHAEQPDLKVVLMSGYGGDEALSESLPELDAMWLEKPFSPCSLAQIVRERLDR